jgi:hypothetical protein
MSGLSFRPARAAGFLALALLALAGCASSGPAALYSQDVSVPTYASAEPIQGMERSTLCHQGRTITIVNIAVAAHLDHGDYFGECSDDGRARQEEYFRAQASNAEPERPGVSGD